RNQQLEYLAEICRHNAHALQKALRYCRDHDIKDFRINSQILPLKTHPDVGYSTDDLPFHDQIIQTFKDCGRFCRKHDLRTTFHPDQFILLSSPKSQVVQRSIADLIYQAEVARWVNADVINIHGGGGYGNKSATLRHLRKTIEHLPQAVRSRLTFENDDRVYTPEDLLPVCRDMGIPLVYDVHHHRCLPDGSSVEATTELAISTWNREPLFHLSSPKYGWDSGKPGNHHDYIDADDFPSCWTNLDITVEVEAKAKELAVLKLKQDLIERTIRAD
ncbi:MAG: UV DNA damage repair endonuclease UvsE, partial [Nitrospinales bacterium]